MIKSELETKLFYYAMWWRVFYGIAKTIFGLILFKLINVPFSELFYTIMKTEISEDPSDIIYTSVQSLLQVHPLSVTSFLAFYVTFWGLVDVFLSINLLRDKIWAFPISLFIIGFFIFYEGYRLFHTHSLTLLSVTLINILMFWLIWREYKKELKKHPTKS